MRRAARPTHAQRGPSLRARAPHIAAICACFVVAGAHVRAANWPGVEQAWCADAARGCVIGSAHGDPRDGLNHVVLAATDDGGRSWQLTDVGLGGGRYSLSSVNAQLGWATYNSGFGSTLLATSDGGMSWEVRKAYPDGHLASVHFVTATSGWGRFLSDVGSGGNIVHTVDGGASWERVVGYDSGPGATSFLGLSRVWTAIGRPRGIMSTRNGGATWGWAQSPEIMFLQFVSPDVGWAIRYGDGTRHVVRSKDGGSTWADVPVAALAKADVGHFYSADAAWVARPAGEAAEETRLFASADGGSTWHERAAIPMRVRAIHRASESHGWVAGTSVLATSDGGATWRDIGPDGADRPTRLTPAGSAIRTWAGMKRDTGAAQPVGTEE